MNITDEMYTVRYNENDFYIKQNTIKLDKQIWFGPLDISLKELCHKKGFKLEFYGNIKDLQIKIRLNREGFNLEKLVQNHNHQSYILGKLPFNFFSAKVKIDNTDLCDYIRDDIQLFKNGGAINYILRDKLTFSNPFDILKEKYPKPEKRLKMIGNMSVKEYVETNLL